jgi:exodeoxyribonuclease VII small subunit
MSKLQKNLKFEQALLKLEGMIQKLEEGELALDESLAVFEEGMELVGFCEQKLAEAEGKIEMITKNHAKEKEGEV